MYSLNYRQPKIDYSSVYSSLGKGIFDDDEEEEKKQQNNSSSIIGSLGSFGNLASGLFGNSTSNTSGSLFGSFGSSDGLYSEPSESSQRWMDFGGNIVDLGKNYLGSGSSSKGFFGKLGGGSSGSSIASGASSSGSKAFSFGGAKGGSGGGTPWALIGQVAKSGYNATTGHDDEDYSDVEESVIYPLQGASIGSMFGPWGALGGALYGLGYSFLDDVGLKKSNFITQITHPIGLGDGGGLRIGGKPILDLG